jgi:hypothetical protein
MKVMIGMMAAPFSFLTQVGAHVGSRSTRSVVHTPHRIKAAPSQTRHISRSRRAKVIRGASRRQPLGSGQPWAAISADCSQTRSQAEALASAMYAQGRAAEDVL